MFKGAEKMSIVYTCFTTDIIHEGHLNIINESKKLGDLVVGVLDDSALIKYNYFPLKSLGISRRHQDFASPILSRRQAIIISISLVDSGLTTRNRPSAISFSTIGYGIVATPSPASNA